MLDVELIFNIIFGWNFSTIYRWVHQKQQLLSIGGHGRSWKMLLLSLVPLSCEGVPYIRLTCNFGLSNFFTYPNVLEKQSRWIWVILVHSLPYHPFLWVITFSVANLVAFGEQKKRENRRKKMEEQHKTGNLTPKTRTNEKGICKDNLHLNRRWIYDICIIRVKTGIEPWLLQMGRNLSSKY